MIDRPSGLYFPGDYGNVLARYLEVLTSAGTRQQATKPHVRKQFRREKLAGINFAIECRCYYENEQLILPLTEVNQVNLSGLPCFQRGRHSHCGVDLDRSVALRSLCKFADLLMASSDEG